MRYPNARARPYVANKAAPSSSLQKTIFNLVGHCRYFASLEVRTESIQSFALKNLHRSDIQLFSRTLWSGSRSGKRSNRLLRLCSLHPIPQQIVKTVELARNWEPDREERRVHRQAVVMGALRAEDSRRAQPRSAALDASFFREDIQIGYIH